MTDLPAHHREKAKKDLHARVFVRSAQVTDINFLLKTFLFSARQLVHPDKRAGWAPSARVRFAEILADPETEILIASDKRTPALILSFLVLHRGTIVFAKTNKQLRRMGLCWLLLGSAKTLDVSRPVPICFRPRFAIPFETEVVGF